jgi:hypothetical protein
MVYICAPKVLPAALLSALWHTLTLSLVCLRSTTPCLALGSLASMHGLSRRLLPRAARARGERHARGRMCALVRSHTRLCSTPCRVVCLRYARGFYCAATAPQVFHLSQSYVGARTYPVGDDSGCLDGRHRAGIRPAAERAEQRRAADGAHECGGGETSCHRFDDARKRRRQRRRTGGAVDAGCGGTCHRASEPPLSKPAVRGQRRFAAHARGVGAIAAAP